MVLFCIWCNSNKITSMCLFLCILSNIGYLFGFPMVLFEFALGFVWILVVPFLGFS